MAKTNIEQEIKRIQEKLKRITDTETKLRYEKENLFRNLDTMRRALAVINEGSLRSSTPPVEEFLGLLPINQNTKLGDAIETILRTRSTPLFRKEIIEAIRKYGVRLSTKNPEQVLANAIKRDKTNRFLVLKDRRVTLRGKNE